MVSRYKDPDAGAVRAPLLLWGPYLWADGVNPRSDDLVWLLTDLESDHVHPSPSGEEKVSTMRALAAAAPFLRRCLLERVRIRRVPVMHFVLDQTIEEAAHVLELMKQLAEGDRPPG